MLVRNDLVGHCCIGHDGTPDIGEAQEEYLIRSEGFHTREPRLFSIRSNIGLIGLISRFYAAVISDVLALSRGTIEAMARVEDGVAVAAVLLNGTSGHVGEASLARGYHPIVQGAVVVILDTLIVEAVGQFVTHHCNTRVSHQTPRGVTYVWHLPAPIPP